MYKKKKLKQTPVQSKSNTMKAVQWNHMEEKVW